jgi:hypothetical protein
MGTSFGRPTATSTFSLASHCRTPPSFLTFFPPTLVSITSRRMNRDRLPGWPLLDLLFTNTMLGTFLQALAGYCGSTPGFSGATAVVKALNFVDLAVRLQGG